MKPTIPIFILFFEINKKKEVIMSAPNGGVQIDINPMHQNIDENGQEHDLQNNYGNQNMGLNQQIEEPMTADPD